METLGLDLGTNSIGWALVDSDLSGNEIIKNGVRIFKEGVDRDKGNEKSIASVRSQYRSRRRLIFRRRLRKIETLKVLIELKLCPVLSVEELQTWKSKKQYPLNSDFMDWLSTNEGDHKNPYTDRYICLNSDLDLSIKEDRYRLGRALYHICQRRGFLSNRLDKTDESAGVVNQGISSLTEVIQKAGYKYIGEFFYSIYGTDKIRKRYCSRNEHYLAEFKEICEKQNLPVEWVKSIERAIFFQRPLKSQKGNIARCTFETSKNCSPISHPLFEEFRMWTFIRSIKIKLDHEEKLRLLTDQEIEMIKPLFQRKSKTYFDFEEIAKKLSGRRSYGFYKSKNNIPKDILFNYDMQSTVTGCPTISALKQIFGEEWENNIIERYTDKTTKKGAKTKEEIIQDVWHVLFTFDSTIKLVEFSETKLTLNPDEADQFASIILKQGYASLSLKAIRKILPWLKQGLNYSHAVFLANIPTILPDSVWSDLANRTLITNSIGSIIESYQSRKQKIELVNSIIKQAKDNNYTWDNNQLLLDMYRKEVEEKLRLSYTAEQWLQKSENEKETEVDELFEILRINMSQNMGKGVFAKIDTIKDEIISFLSDNFDLQRKDLNKIYHPSDLSQFRPALRNDKGIYQLGSPRISSIKNPMVMRCMFEMRKLINELLRQHIITPNTVINVELAREMNDANKRIAIQNYQKRRQKVRAKYCDEIKKELKAQGIANYEPTEEDILRYELWFEEQNMMCLYTGRQIRLSDFIGSDPQFDIEHTLPQSVSFDNSMMNKTLCDRNFNREIKRNKLPSELNNHDEILSRIEHWEDKIISLNTQIKRCNQQIKQAADKDRKDQLIRERHLLRMDYDYWKGKYDRFTMSQVKEGFKNSQLSDTGTITKYTLMFLKSLFKRVNPVNGSVVAELRKLWGIQDEFSKKSRDTHLHHTIDAIVIAGIPKNIQTLLQEFYARQEAYKIGSKVQKPTIEAPWRNFVVDIKNIQNNTMIDHVMRDNLLKQANKHLRKRGIIQKSKDGKPIKQKGDSARGALHQESFYGAIQQENQLVYVKRRFVSDLKETDIKNIIDPVVRQKIQDAVERDGEKALKGLIWMNEEKKIPIVKVRCNTNVTNPIKLKKQRDHSLNEYKKYFYVTNDSNHRMFIFEGLVKGKIKRDFALLSNLESIQLNKLHSSSLASDIQKSQNIAEHLKYKYTLVIGTKVLLWEKSPEEIWDCSLKEIQKRYFIVTGLSIQRIKRPSNKIDTYATIVLRHSIDSRPTTDLRMQDGAFIIGEDYKPLRKLNHNQFNALVEGVDFRFNILGEIERIE